MVPFARATVISPPDVKGLPLPGGKPKGITGCCNGCATGAIMGTFPAAGTVLTVIGLIIGAGPVGAVTGGAPAAPCARFDTVPPPRYAGMGVADGKAAVPPGASTTGVGVWAFFHHK